jgi:hypothetical protein
MHRKLCIPCTIACARVVFSLPHSLKLSFMPFPLKKRFLCLVLDMTRYFRDQCNSNNLNSVRSEEIVGKLLFGTKFDT